jgi:hypothetical protein
MATRYLQPEAFKAWTRNEIQTDDDEWIEDAIDAATQWLDNELGRRVELATGSATSRVFVPNGTPILPIDDCVSVASITENGSLVAAAAYQLEPLNGRTVAGESVPYSSVRRLYDIDWYADYGRATISISADWGWATIPALILESCKIVAKDILANRTVTFGIVAATEQAAFSARLNPTVAKTIEQYGSPQGLTIIDFIGA